MMQYTTFDYPWMVIIKGLPLSPWTVCGFYKTLDEALAVYKRLGGRTVLTKGAVNVKLCAR